MVVVVVVGGWKEEKRMWKEERPCLGSLLGRNLGKTKRGNVVVSPKSYAQATLIPDILLPSSLKLSSAQTHLFTLDSDLTNIYCTLTICQAHNATVISITILNI